MLTTDQRRERLEALLKKVQQNRGGTGPAAAPPVSVKAEPKAPPAKAALPVARPAAEPSPSKPKKGLEIETSDSLLDLELDSSLEDGGGMVIDLSSTEEKKAEPTAPAVAKTPTPKPVPSGPAPRKTPTPVPELVAPPTIVEPVELVPSPKLAPPSPAPRPAPDKKPPAPAADRAAGPGDAGPDDEPEIEVSYGTEEALALQAELGLGDLEELPEAEEKLAAGDHLTLADMPYSPPSDARPTALDDLPAPAPSEDNVEDLLEIVPTAVKAAAVKAPAPPSPAPKAAAPAPAPEAKPPLAPASVLEPKITEPKISEPTRLRAKTVEDLSGPLVELSLGEEPVKAKVGAVEKLAKPKQEFAQTIETPIELGDLGPASTRPDERPTPAEAQETVRPTEPEPQAEPQVLAYAAAKIAKPEAKVAALSGEVPRARARTLSELIRRALAVGRKN